jgi:hypothetical protein
MHRSCDGWRKQAARWSEVAHVALRRCSVAHVALRRCSVAHVGARLQSRIQPHRSQRRQKQHQRRPPRRQGVVNISFIAVSTVRGLNVAEQISAGRSPDRNRARRLERPHEMQCNIYTARRSPCVRLAAGNANARLQPNLGSQAPDSIALCAGAAAVWPPRDFALLRLRSPLSPRRGRGCDGTRCRHTR